MNSKGLPKPDLSRIQKIQLQFVVQTYLAQTRSGLSPTMLQSRLKTLAAPKIVRETVMVLQADGIIIKKGNKLVLSDSAQGQIRKKLGRDAKASANEIRNKRLPILALGYDPDDSAVRKQLAEANALRSAILAMAYGLSKEAGLSLVTVRSEIVWQILRGALGEKIGRGPFPPISDSNVVDRTILASLTETKAKTTNDAVGALAAKVLGAAKATPAALRLKLIEIAIQHGSEVAAQPVDSDFAQRVKSVAEKLSTPPFRGRVAIAQVYDEFGRHHRDAGSLASFKQRLVTAARARELDLGRLDLPEHMSRDLRERSITKWGSDEVHFVITEWY